MIRRSPDRLIFTINIIISMKYWGGALMKDDIPTCSDGEFGNLHVFKDRLSSYLPPFDANTEHGEHKTVPRLLIEHQARRGYDAALAGNVDDIGHG